MSQNNKEVLLDPLFNNNPIALQVLGICSALAVTTKMETALVMSIALTAVLTCSNVAVSVIRQYIPASIRIIVQLTIIASLVIVTDQILKAFLFDISKQLSVFVGLIITNCSMVVLCSRQMSCGISHTVSVMSRILLVLVLVVSFGELFGSGSLFGTTLFKSTEGGDTPNGLWCCFPSLPHRFGIWALRTWKTDQIEAE